MQDRTINKIVENKLIAHIDKIIKAFHKVPWIQMCIRKKAENAFPLVTFIPYICLSPEQNLQF